MLFNSYIFIFCFLPIVIGGVALLLKGGAPARHLMYWLLFVSFVFYAYWEPAYLLLLFASIVANYHLGKHLSRYRKKGLLWAALALNLGLLIFFKYNRFILANLNVQTSLEFPALPLAISFFTFQQIAFLVDAYRGETEEPSFLRYGLFVSFFPQLIAGPIVRHQQVKEQLSAISLRRDHITQGAIAFILGLAKKLIIADRLSVYTSHFFLPHLSHDLLTGWLGALCFAFEIYFDFSAYSDMAIGLARILGIEFPQNFNSPYQSASIIDFWRRWHITLSFFLRDYLYIPLGGSRRGAPRQLINLSITMLLGGLWHGANWTFVIWGGMHGLFLIINHVWRRCQAFFPIAIPKGLSFLAGWALTFSSAVFAFVVFRAENLQVALNIWRGMLGLNGLKLPVPHQYRPDLGFLESADLSIAFSQPKMQIVAGGALVIICLIITWLPNAHQLTRRFSQGHKTVLSPAYIAALSALCLLFLNQHAPFIYFIF